MSFFDFNITLRLPPEFFTAVDRIVAAITTTGVVMTDQIDNLDTKLTALDTKLDETTATLAALATTVTDLRALIGNTAALEAAVIHAADRADKMLAKIGVAEDAADDVLTPPTP